MVLANGFVDLDVVLNPVAEDVVAAVANWQSAHPSEATVFETAGLVMLLAQPVSGLDEIMEQFLEARMGLRLADKEEVGAAVEDEAAEQLFADHSGTGHGVEVLCLGLGPGVGLTGGTGRAMDLVRGVDLGAVEGHENAPVKAQEREQGGPTRYKATAPKKPTLRTTDRNLTCSDQ